MTKEKVEALRFWGAILLTAIVIPLASYAFTKYDATNLKVPRFVQDSAVIMNRDSAWKATVMARFDRLQDGQDSIALRLTQIRCGPSINRGCR